MVGSQCQIWPNGSQDLVHGLTSAEPPPKGERRCPNEWTRCVQNHLPDTVHPTHFTSRLCSACGFGGRDSRIIFGFFSWWNYENVEAPPPLSVSRTQGLGEARLRILRVVSRNVGPYAIGRVSGHDVDKVPGWIQRVFSLSNLVTSDPDPAFTRNRGTSVAAYTVKHLAQYNHPLHESPAILDEDHPQTLGTR